MTITEKESPATANPAKPWVAEAIEAGRNVPRWIAELQTKKEFADMMDLRERAFPKTKRVTQ
jgi:hypothetical protein